MSIAEFYIENGIDPTDPDSMDNFLRSHAYDHPESVGFELTGFAIDGFTADYSNEDAVRYVLNESELDYMAETRGWDKLDTSSSAAPMASYRREDCRLNFWLTTGTVGSYLEHPNQGRTQLFRRQIDMSEAASIFHNPRQHTGRGYHRRHDAPPNRSSRSRRPCRYGSNCRNPNCRFDHSRPRASGGGRGPCRYGSRCTRQDCWFDHY